MKFARLWKAVLASVAVIAIVFILVSLLDLGISMIYKRFYSPAAFIFSYGIGGIFAAVFGFFYGIQLAHGNAQLAKWTLIFVLIVAGLLIFFFFSKLEGEAYEPAFKAFGATLALGSLLFINFDRKD